MQKISCEIIATPGPRKKHNAELGEDAAGVMNASHTTTFFVIDGASNNRKTLEYSTRTLAQDLGQNVFEELSERQEIEIVYGIETGQEIVADILNKAFIRLMREWSTKLAMYIRTRKKELEEGFSTDEDTERTTGVTHLDHLDFSATIIVGIVTMNSTVQTARIGDVELVVHNEEGLHVCNKDKRRVYVRLKRNGDRYRFVKTRIVEDIITTTHKKVDLVVAGTDGTEDIAEFIETQFDHFSWREIRRRIPRLSPRKADDKALCIIQLS